MTGAGAGSLRELVTVQRFTNAPDGQGGFVRNWAAAATVHAEVTSLSGREAFQADVLRGVEVWDVTLRFRRDVGVTDRLVWRGITMNIRSTGDPDGRRTWLVLRCESGVGIA